MELPKMNTRNVTIAGGGLSAVAGILTLAAQFIGPWEGFYPKPYVDIVGVKTVCYGATGSDLNAIDLNKTYTKAECEAMLANNLPKYYTGWQKCVTAPRPYTVQMQVAFTSFTYNLGAGAFCNGSVAAAVKVGNYKQACHNLRKYNMAKVTSSKHCVKGTYRNASGRCPVKGLDNRRISEEKLCLEGL